MTKHHEQLSTQEFIVLGYGFARKVADDPNFIVSELAQELEHSSIKLDQRYLYKPVHRLVARTSLKSLGFDRRNPTGPVPKAYAITELGQSQMLKGLDHKIRNGGKNLTELLRLPGSIEAVEQHTDFGQNLAKNIFGHGGVEINFTPPQL